MSLAAFWGLSSARRSNAASMVAARSAYMLMENQQRGLEEAASVALLALAADEIPNAVRCFNAFRHGGHERDAHAILAGIAARHVSRDVAARQHGHVVLLEQTACEALTVADARPQIERRFGRVDFHN